MSRSTDKLALLTETANAVIRSRPDLISKLSSVEINWVEVGLHSGDPVVVPNVKIVFKDDVRVVKLDRTNLPPDAPHPPDSKCCTCAL